MLLSHCRASPRRRARRAATRAAIATCTSMYSPTAASRAIQLHVFVQPTGLDTETMQIVDARVESVGVHVRVSTGAGRHGSSRQDFHAHGRNAVRGASTIGTAFALAHTGVLKPGAARTMFGLGRRSDQCRSRVEGRQARLRLDDCSSSPTFGKSITDGAAVAAAIGLDPGASAAKAGVPAGQEVNCGSNFFIVPLATRKAVDAAVLDRAKVDALFNAAGIQRRGIYDLLDRERQDDATAYSRLLSAGGIEDPATGSAAVRPDRSPRSTDSRLTVLAAGSGTIVFLQGVLVRRPSRIHVRIGAEGGEITSVSVGGSSVVVGEGTMTP